MIFSRFLNLTPRQLVRREIQSGQFRINEDLSLSANNGKDETDVDNDEMENNLAMVGAVPGAVDQISVSYMDYLQDAQVNIENARNLTQCWLFKYDGLNPSINFLNEQKLFLPVSETVEEQTLCLLTNFVTDSDLVTLEQLGKGIKF